MQKGIKMDIIFTHDFYKGMGRHKNPGFDVSITLGKTNGEYKRIRFGFRQSAFDKIPNTVKYVQISNVIYSEPRIYFKFTPEPEGQCYTLITQGKACRSMWISPSGKEADILRKWAGGIYALHYDVAMNLYYIEQTGGNING